MFASILLFEFSGNRLQVLADFFHLRVGQCHRWTRTPFETHQILNILFVQFASLEGVNSITAFVTFSSHRSGHKITSGWVPTALVHVRVFDDARSDRLGAVRVDKEHVPVRGIDAKHCEPTAGWRPQNCVQLCARFELRYQLRYRFAFVDSINERSRARILTNQNAKFVA